MPRTLLIDADVLAYKCAAGSETAVNWGGETDDDCMWQVTANETKAKADLHAEIDNLMSSLDADAYVLALTDTLNWRHGVLPSYKGNRASVRKPLILPQMRAYMRDSLDAWQRPGLEGDDILGILSGLRDRFPGERIVVTVDKDLSTVPGLHYRPHRSVLGAFEVTEASADRFHLLQGIAGDPTDGYSGCPSWGMKTAEEWLADPYELVAEKFTQHKGKFAGVERTRYVKAKSRSLWPSILSLYAKEGLDEEYALKQFQVARILRTTDYNFQTKEPILWKPTNIM